jgi:hypothetical protein
VRSGSFADLQGLEPGLVIIRINKQPTATKAQYDAVVSKLKTATTWYLRWSIRGIRAMESTTWAVRLSNARGAGWGGIQDFPRQKVHRWNEFPGKAGVLPESAHKFRSRISRILFMSNARICVEF